MRSINHYTVEDISMLRDLLRREAISGSVLYDRGVDNIANWRFKTYIEIHRDMRTPRDGGFYGGFYGRRGLPSHERVVWSKYFDKARQLIFYKSLEDMPLYVNEVEPLRIIAAWRLRLAR